MKNIISLIVPLTTMLIICRAFPVLNFLYYAVPVILLITLIFNLTPYRKYFPQSKNLKTVILLLIAFTVWAALTSTWSSHPYVSLSRAAYFFLISVSPLILGYLWRQENKNDLFGFLLPANVLVVVVSLYSLFTSTPDDAWTGGHGMGFMGYAGHQNTLASVLVFTIPSVLYPLLKAASTKMCRVFKESKTFGQLPAAKLIFLIILLILNLYFIVITVSRAAMLILVVMVFVYVALSFSFKTALAVFLILISVYTALFFTVQQVKDLTFKTENTIGDRRKININATIEAAKNGGLSGIGYGISETPSDSLTRGRSLGDEKRFDREKMISALALIEETGVIGLVFFLLPIFYVLKQLMKKYLRAVKEKGVNSFILRSETAMVISVLIALMLHAQIEGWWVGVGSVHLPMFFLMLNTEC